MIQIELLGKVAIITGAGRGIGRAIALELAGEGADVALCDIDGETLKATGEEILNLGRKCCWYQVDVTNSEGVAGMIKNITSDFSSIDILVNNAGITRDGLMMRMKDEDWDKVLEVNLKSAFLLTRAVSKIMFKARQGRIVNIASVIGVIGNAGQANYAASKSGIIGLTKSVAKEFASRGINANAIAPGFIKTPMTDRLTDQQKEAMLQNIPLGYFGEPRDVAKVVSFLVSESSRYITGQVINVDGGMVM